MPRIQRTKIRTIAESLIESRKERDTAKELVIEYRKLLATMLDGQELPILLERKGKGIKDILIQSKQMLVTDTALLKLKFPLIFDECLKPISWIHIIEINKKRKEK